MAAITPKTTTTSSSDFEIALHKPTIVYTDEDLSVKPPAYATIDALALSLQAYGPLVAMGKMGPTAYTQASFKLPDTFNDQALYGWKKDTFNEKCTISASVLLLGIKQTASRSYVYFTLATDITRSSSSMIRGYTPSALDAKIYVMSYDNFLNRSLSNLHPICPHGDWLFTTPADSLLDGAEIEKKCHEIGQQIFDDYKKEAHGDSLAGKKAVVRICEAAKVLTSDGRVRKSHIEFAWDRIGDSTWRWMR